jgi:type IX secretion system PorP/SprF family membrane protein
MHNITAIHRDQWDGLDKDPKTYMFNYSGIYGAKQNIGFGATIYSEVLGQQQNTVVRFSPSYHLAMSNGNFVSLGLSIGMYGSKLGANWVFIDSGDPSIPVSEKAQSGADLGFGATVYKPNQYYFGVSSTHLAGPNLDDLGIQLARHYYVMGGYEYPIANANIVLRPNVLVKSDANSTQIDINADAYWNNMLWGGLAFRPGDAICPYVGFHYALPGTQMGQKMGNHGLKIGYAYDVTTSEIRNYSSGSHEIFLHYYLGLTDIPIRAKHHDVRFL